MAEERTQRRLAAILAAAETTRLSNGEWQPFLSKDAPHHGFVLFSDDATALGGATGDISNG